VIFGGGGLSSFFGAGGFAGAAGLTGIWRFVTAASLNSGMESVGKGASDPTAFIIVSL